MGDDADVLAPRGVDRRILRSEQRDRPHPEKRREVGDPCVRADEEVCPSKESDRPTEGRCRRGDRGRLPLPHAFDDPPRHRFLSRSPGHDDVEPHLLDEAVSEAREAGDGPPLELSEGARAGVKDGEGTGSTSRRIERLVGEPAIGLVIEERRGRGGPSDSERAQQSQVLVDPVENPRIGLDMVRVREVVPLAAGSLREADANGGAGREREDRALEVALEIECEVEPLATKGAKECEALGDSGEEASGASQGSGEAAPLEDEHAIDIGESGEKIGVAVLDEPRQVRVRKGGSQRRDRRHGDDDVSECAQPKHQDLRGLRER